MAGMLDTMGIADKSTTKRSTAMGMDMKSETMPGAGGLSNLQSLINPTRMK